MPNSFLILQVFVRVRPDCGGRFREATLINARASAQEPGVVRFDVLQDRNDANRFVLFEVYKDPQAHAAHRESAHYQLWRETVNDMMAEPRQSRRLVNLHPDDDAF